MANLTAPLTAGTVEFWFKKKTFPNRPNYMFSMYSPAMQASYFTIYQDVDTLLTCMPIPSTVNATKSSVKFTDVLYTQTGWQYVSCQYTLG